MMSYIKMSTKGRGLNANISTEGHKICMLNELSCVIWPTIKIWNFSFPSCYAYTSFLHFAILALSVMWRHLFKPLDLHQNALLAIIFISV